MGWLGNLFNGGTSVNAAVNPAFYDKDADRMKRLAMFQRTWQAYLAELPDPIEVTGPSNDNVKVNPARAIINTGVYFLFGNELEFKVSPDAAQKLGRQESFYGGSAYNSDPKNRNLKPNFQHGDDDYFDRGDNQSNNRQDSRDNRDDRDNQDSQDNQKSNRSEQGSNNRDDQQNGNNDRFKNNERYNDHERQSFGGGRRNKSFDRSGPGFGQQNTMFVQESPKWLQDLNKCWKANRKQSLLHNLGLSGAIHGTPFIKIIPKGAGVNNEYPRLLVLDPANVDVEWDPNDCSRVLKYTIDYIVEEEGKDPVRRMQEIKANQDPAQERILNWTMQNFEQPMHEVKGQGWMPAPGEKTPIDEPETWPYTWAPIEHCQNIEMPHMFWGLPDLDESSVEVIESLQRSMSSLNKIVRVHASPRMFAQNVMPDQVDEIDVSADNIITLPNMDSNLTVLQTLQNIAPSIQYAQEQRKMLLEMVQVPPIALGQFDSASTAISGVTLSILYAPLLQKTDLKRISYGDMIERLNTKLLVLLGYTDPNEYEGLTIIWPESMPGSAYLERQTLEQDQKLGASQHTILSRLGYDPREEQAHMLHEQEQQMELKQRYAPEMQFGNPNAQDISESVKRSALNKAQQEDRGGGNNNPSGKGNPSGSMGGTKSAGVQKGQGKNPNERRRPPSRGNNRL